MAREMNPILIPPADQAALDALVEAGYNPQAVSAEHRGRSQRMADLLGLLNYLPEQRTGDLLIQRTLQQVARARQQERINQHIDQLARPVGGFNLGISLRELMAIAAMFIIGLSLIWPMLANARGAARAIACRQGLATAGMGFASYSKDANGSLPATKSRFGDPWWLTGQFDDEGYAMSNSAHLFQLIRSGLIKPDCLNCAENTEAPFGLTLEQAREMRDWQHGGQASYSYQNLYTLQRPRINRDPTVAILADKNPFFDPGEYHFDLGQSQRDQVISRNHAARNGQNVLLSDGSVIWIGTSRLANKDNIFHAGFDGLDNYTGFESPSDLSDSFLVW